MTGGQLLRIFLGELDKVHGQPLFEAILAAAQKEGLAGATVLRGLESFGSTRQVHSAKVLRLAQQLPLVVEIVDSEEKIQTFLPVVDDLMSTAKSGGLITLENVQMRVYSSE